MNSFLAPLKSFWLEQHDHLKPFWERNTVKIGLGAGLAFLTTAFLAQVYWLLLVGAVPFLVIGVWTVIGEARSAIKLYRRRRNSRKIYIIREE